MAWVQYSVMIIILHEGGGEGRGERGEGGGREGMKVKVWFGMNGHDSGPRVGGGGGTCRSPRPGGRSAGSAWPGSPVCRPPTTPRSNHHRV